VSSGSTNRLDDRDDFARALDRAIMRSSKLIEGKAVEPPQAE
jgi:hypothetical protein